MGAQVGFDSRDDIYDYKLAGFLYGELEGVSHRRFKHPRCQRRSNRGTRRLHIHAYPLRIYGRELFPLSHL
jgi:hypothetical protein